METGGLTRVTRARCRAGLCPNHTVSEEHPMRTTIQRNVQTAACSSLLLLSTLGAAGQSTFQNLGFENTTLTVILVNPSGPWYATNATVPGWTWSPLWNAGYGDPNTIVSFNDSAMDGAAVTLHGADPYYPSLSGTYSILLQGGSQWVPPEYPHGASIFQTGNIPPNAHSLIYLGGAALQVTFNGQLLSPVALENAPTYTEWGIDISPYAGQSGELRFAVPWLTSSMLDGIQLSSLRVPEPSALSLGILGFVLVAAFTRWPNQSRQPRPGERQAAIRASLARRGCVWRSRPVGVPDRVVDVRGVAVALRGQPPLEDGGLPL